MRRTTRVGDASIGRVWKTPHVTAPAIPFARLSPMLLAELWSVANNGRE